MKRKYLAAAVAATGLTLMSGATIFGHASAGVIGDDASGEGTVPDTDPAYPPSSDTETTVVETTVVVTTAAPTTAAPTTAAPTTAAPTTAAPTTASPTTAPTGAAPTTEVAAQPGVVVTTAPDAVSAAGAVATTAAPGALPVTGSDSVSTVQIGVVSVLTGAGLIAVGATRRKRRRIV